MSKKNNKKINKKLSRGNILTKTIILSMIIIILTIIVVDYNIKLELIGNESETIKVFNTYRDPGCKATLFNINLKDNVKTTSNLNNDIIGTYNTTCTISFISKKEISREIKVIDSEKPTIKLNGNSTINIYINEEYEDEGVTVKDNYDKDLTNNITIENNINNSIPGIYTIKYTVHDSSNNTNDITRNVIVKERKITYSNKTCNQSNKIEKYICEKNYDISIGYYNLTNNKTYYYKSNKLYYGASLIKTLDALYLYDKNLVTDELKEYVKKAITISDNLSHHVLVEHIGRETLKQYGISLGAKNTLYGHTDNFGYTSVNDQIIYMKKLYNLTYNKNEELKSFFTNTRKNYLIFENSPTIMHKYGHWEYVYHNVGVVLDNNPYIIAILTNEGYDDYKNIIKDISKLVYEYHNEN